jgi:fatty-acyl-CoA synthase
VAEAFGDLPGVESVTVYGVQVPGAEGRAGMAAVVMEAGCEFDPWVLRPVRLERLPRYAAPLFVRVAAQADMTTTFKLRKVELQRQGFDPAVVPTRSSYATRRPWQLRAAHARGRGACAGGLKSDGLR